MTAQVVAIRLAQSGAVRRLLGCGCLAIAGLTALPLLLIAAMTGGAFGSTGAAGADQSDPFSLGNTGMIIGSGEPLPPGSFRVTQGFGCTSVPDEPPPPAPYACPTDPAHRESVRFHTGIDLAAPTGTPVAAVVAGTVRVLISAGGFGLHVVLIPDSTAAGMVTYLYGHLSAVAVPDGGQVMAGAPIGAVGSSGNSTGPHLHFEVDVGEVPANPCAIFPAGYLAPAGVAAGGCEAGGL